MKRAKYLLITYLIFVAFFMAGKPVFLLYHWKESASRGFVDYLSTIWHGLPMDLSVAGYFTAFAGLILLISVFVSPKICGKILHVYFLLVSVLIAALYIPDMELYKHWGFRIDSTIFNYISQPVEAVAGISFWAVAALLLFTLCTAAVLYFALSKLAARPATNMRKSGYPLSEPPVILLMLGLMFVGIRGGLTTSTMNVGRVYYSEDVFLNHTAINPVFSMLYSLKLKDGFDKQYRFMDDREATACFDEAFSFAPSPPDSIPMLLNTDRPNIVFILLESFGSAVMQSLGGREGVTPQLDRLASEGILFSKMYANSFRTDRGIVSALAGYPAQPTMSIIKYPKKSEQLRSIMSSLKENGYRTSFLYGGDVDFAYIKSFLVNQKVTDITRDTDFPVKELLNKWGAPDHIAFRKLLQQIEEEKEQPYMKTFLTLSSHEPFDVPYSHFDDPYINSVAYTDSCLGSFVEAFRQRPEWSNTLLILVPDHAMKYPSSIEYFSPERHSVFMVWAGGAVKEPAVISDICSQTDIAATLLNQLKLDSREFAFSRNILDPAYKESAFYTFPNGFGAIDTSGYVVYDCNAMNLISSKRENPEHLVNQGKAYLQKLYDDIASK